MIGLVSDSFAFLNAEFGSASSRSLLQLFLFSGASIDLAPEAESVHK